MRKKGFTLIELLAVIVILAIIVLIAIPLIGNVIEKSKIGALENSVNGLVESANMYYANQGIKGEQMAETTFDFANGEQINSQKLEYKGKVYNGKLILHANGEVAVCIDDKEHYAYKNKDTDDIVSGIGTCLYDGTTGDFSSNSPLEDLKKQIAQATATSDKVLEGNTIYTSSGLITGTMVDNANKTISAKTIEKSDDGVNAIIKIPEEGHYDETSQISIPISEINNKLKQFSISSFTLNMGTGSMSVTQSPQSQFIIDNPYFTKLDCKVYTYMGTIKILESSDGSTWKTLYTYTNGGNVYKDISITITPESKIRFLALASSNVSVYGTGVVVKDLVLS